MKYILVPGFGSCRQFFENFLAAAPMNIDILEIADHSPDAIERQLENIVSREGSIHLAGWSLGSLYAMQWTMDHPASVTSLFLTGTTARFCEKEGYLNGINSTVLAKMIRLIHRRTGLVMEDFYRSLLSSTHDAQHYHKVLMDNLSETSSLVIGLQSLQDMDLLERLSEISAPVMIYHGINDPVTPVYGAEFAAACINGVLLEKYDGGHSPFTERPGEIALKWKEFACSVKK